MGNDSISKFEESIWQPIQTTGTRTVLRNRKSLFCVQKHFTSNEHDELIGIENIYKWRSQLPLNFHIVQIYEYGIKRGGTCDAVDQFYVISERVYKIGEIPYFSKPQAFLIIKQVLIALQKLKQKFGLFSPNVMKLGINQEGQIRVWVNENYASNILEEDQKGHPRRQQAVVNNLCRLLSRHVYNNQLKGEYPQHLNFTKAYKYVTDYMSSDRNYYINKVYRDRNQFAKEYVHRRGQFSKTRSRQVNSQYSKLTLQKLPNQPIFNHPRPLSKNNSIYSHSRRSSNDISHAPWIQFENTICRQPGPGPILVQRRPFVPRPPTSLSNRGTVGNEQRRVQIHIDFVNKTGQLPIRVNRTNKTKHNAHMQKIKMDAYLPSHNHQKMVNEFMLPVQNLKKEISQRSQIRIYNNLEEVDSVIVVQEEDLLEQMKDEFPLY